MNYVYSIRMYITIIIVIASISYLITEFQPRQK